MQDRDPLLPDDKALTEYGLQNPEKGQNEKHKAISIPVESAPPGGDVQPNFSLYLKRTIFLCFGCMCLGLNAVEVPSTFLDLLLLVKTDIASGSILYTASSLGSAIGTLLSGFVNDMFNTDLLLFLAIFFMGLFSIVMSWCPSLWLMATLNAFRGATFGSLDTVGNTACVRMWKDKGGPYIQALHTSFSVGGILAPLISEPFLAPKDNPTISSASHLNVVYTEFGDNKSASLFNLTDYSNNDTHVQIAYLITGAITISCSFPFLALFCIQSRTLSGMKAADDATVSAKTSGHPDLSVSERITCLCFLGLFYMFYVSLEVNTAGFLMAFVVKHLDWSKHDGSTITAAFWIAFTAGRFLGIVTSTLLTPWKMLLIDLVLVNVILVPLWFLSCENDVMAWICFPMSGLFQATIFATGISWTDQAIMRVNGKISTVIFLSSAFGGLFVPMLTGYLFENITPMWFIYLMSIEAGICFTAFMALTTLLVMKRRQSRTKFGLWK